MARATTPHAGLLTALDRADRRMGKLLYAAAQRSAALRLAAQVASFSGDEAVWIAPAAFYISFAFAYGFYARGWSSVASCAEQCMCDVFGVSCVANLIEILAKLAFSRPRPTYARQKQRSDLPGEAFSFPSGHSLRAGMAACWLVSNPHARLMLAAAGLPTPQPALAALWACAVATARAALGRHFPLDCLCGLAVGFAAGSALEGASHAVEAGAMLRGAVKTVAGVAITAIWGSSVAIPMMQSALPARWRERSHGPLMCAWVAFYAAFLLVRAPRLGDEWWPASCAQSSRR